MNYEIENLQINLTIKRGRYKINGFINSVPVKVFINDSELYDSFKDGCLDSIKTASEILKREFNKLFSFELLSDQEGIAYFNYFGNIQYLSDHELTPYFVDFKNCLVYVK